jgi:hypothetical protein
MLFESCDSSALPSSHGKVCLVAVRLEGRPHGVLPDPAPNARSQPSTTSTYARLTLAVLTMDATRAATS